MKKNWLLLLAMFPLAMQAQNKQLTISGNTVDAENCGVLFSYVAPDKSVKKDTMFVKNGKFSTRGEAFNERVIGQVIVYAQPKDYSVLFYLEPGSIQLNLEGDRHKDRRGGTPLNNELQQYTDMETVALDSVNSQRKPEERLTRYSPDAQPIVLDVVRKYMLKYPHSVIGIDQMELLVRGYKKPEALITVFNLMDDAVKSSKEGMAVKAAIDGMRATAIGNTAPDFSLPDSKGKELALSSLKGKYVLIDFWATWCVPCMAEMPNVKKAYTQFSNKNFEILGVSLDKPGANERWLEVIKKQELNWPQVSDFKFWDSKVVSLYDLSSIPMNFLLDPSGKIIAKNLRGEALTEKLTAVLK